MSTGAPSSQGSRDSARTGAGGHRATSGPSPEVPPSGHGADGRRLSALLALGMEAAGATAEVREDS